MTLEGTFVSDRTCHLPDVNGFQSQIPVRDLPGVVRAARDSDDERAFYLGPRERVGHWFNRDVLIGALDLITPRTPCDNGCDNDGTEPMDGGEKWCATCCSAAQGSHHDDKENWT